jgi:hypothetical protein
MSAVKASYIDLLDKAHDTVVVFVAPPQHPRNIKPRPPSDLEKFGSSRNTPTHEVEGRGKKISQQSA